LGISIVYITYPDSIATIPLISPRRYEIVRGIIRAMTLPLRYPVMTPIRRIVVGD
jgi:hypothetical protein